MFYLLSKIGFFLIQPSNALVALGIIGVALTWTRWIRFGRWLGFLAVLFLGIAGLSPAANILILPLEERFPRPQTLGKIDGIIVLGGAFDTTVMAGRGEPALTSAAERLTSIAALARQIPDVPVIHTGGAGGILFKGVSEAEGAKVLLEDFGVSSDRIILEDKSRSTFENARFTRNLIRPEPEQRWLFVTSAYHMPRAVGVFRAEGWTGLVPYPVDYRTRGWADAGLVFSGVSIGLRRFDIAFKEWVGLAGYWIFGRTGTLFPAPEPGQ
ncbi:YdcF family protein [Roseibium litorale]|uniref:YdcF family protein n=1 Tax=Roseibium litorale TaxID=2803841 RepID=A0ABR9CGX3_9HYPH|nr:YdcF family protein [Roseibium litorale]MBD8890122.1 YdcF family protein [Roseibium litorale]